MKTKGISTRTDRFPPATILVDPKINALLEASRVRCSCVSNGDFDNSFLISCWNPSSEEMRVCQHKNADNLVQAVLTCRNTPRSSGLPKKTNSASTIGQAMSVTPAQKLSNRQTATRQKQKPSEFQHFMTAADHIGWYRESYTSCPTMGQFPHFSRTFHPSLSIAQENNIVSIDNEIGNCYTEQTSTTEENSDQPFYVLRKVASAQHNIPTVTTAATTSEERNSDHSSGISSTDKNFYPSPVTFQEPSNGFISSFFPKLHRSSYYRAHAQRKLLHRGSRLLELYPRIYGKIDVQKICGLQYLQPKQFSVPSISHENYDDENGNDENGEEDDSQANCQPQDSVSSVDCTDQSVNGTYSSFMWEVDDNNSNVVLPFSVDDPKQQNPSLRKAMKKLSTIQRRRYTFPTYSMEKRQDSPKQFEITGIHYTTLVSPMGTVPRLPKNSTTAKQLAKRRSKQDKRSPVLHKMISMSGSSSASDRLTKNSYTETSKHIFPFKNESETCYKTNCVTKDRSHSQQRDISLHNNCMSKSRRRVLHKYLATRLQQSGNFDRLSRQTHKTGASVKLGIIMPNAKECIQATQEN